MASPDQQELRQELELLGLNTTMPIHFVGKTINTLVIGEEHWCFPTAEARLIRWIKPSEILHEGLGGTIYDPKQKILLTQPSRKYFPDELEILWQNLTSDPTKNPFSRLPFKEASDDLGILLIGCDTTSLENWQKAIVKYKESADNIRRLLAPGNEAEFLNLTDMRTRTYRDNFIGSCIKKHIGTPIKPTVAVIGHVHAQYIHEAMLLNNYCYFEAVSPATRAKWVI